MLHDSALHKFTIDIDIDIWLYVTELASEKQTGEIFVVSSASTLALFYVHIHFIFIYYSSLILLYFHFVVYFYHLL